MSIAEKITQDLKEAMIARDADRTSALRMIRAEILKKEKEAVGTVVGDDAALALLQTLAKQRRDSIEQFRNGGREEMAKKEESELAIIMGYLPAALSEAEILAEIDKAIAAVGATSAKEMGKVMGPLMKNLKATGKTFDGTKINAQVKARLEPPAQ